MTLCCAIIVCSGVDIASRHRRGRVVKQPSIIYTVKYHNIENNGIEHKAEESKYWRGLTNESVAIVAQACYMQCA